VLINGVSAWRLVRFSAVTAPTWSTALADLPT